MNRRSLLKAGVGLSIAPWSLLWQGQAQSSRPVTMPAEASNGWVSLFNGKNLDGWYTMLGKSGRGVAEKRKMVTVEQGMLHIMGNEAADLAEPGYLATFDDYGDVHIRVEYKWGMKRFTPRTLAKRDNGILYGLVGEDKVWPRCAECQIEEDDVGDAYLLDGIRGVQDTHGNGLFGQGLEPDGWPRSVLEAKKSGTAPVVEPRTGRMVKDGSFEKLDDWNVVEVIFQGDRAAHIVNGRTVNVIHTLQQPDPSKPGAYIPLTKGKIGIEIEYAETWFRRIEIKSLSV